MELAAAHLARQGTDEQKIRKWKSRTWAKVEKRQNPASLDSIS
jgi:hypothetical protein